MHNKQVNLRRIALIFTLNRQKHSSLTLGLSQQQPPFLFSATKIVCTALTVNTFSQTIGIKSDGPQPQKREADGGKDIRCIVSWWKHPRQGWVREGSEGSLSEHDDCSWRRFRMERCPADRSIGSTATFSSYSVARNTINKKEELRHY